MKVKVIAVLATIAALVAAAPASAGWFGNSVKAAGRYAQRHHPSEAVRYRVRCQQAGWHSSDCAITFYDDADGYCQVMVTVTGAAQRVRKYDSTC